MMIGSTVDKLRSGNQRVAFTVSAEEQVKSSNYVV